MFSNGDKLHIYLNDGMKKSVLPQVQSKKVNAKVKQRTLLLLSYKADGSRNEFVLNNLCHFDKRGTYYLEMPGSICFDGSERIQL